MTSHRHRQPRLFNLPLRPMTSWLIPGFPKAFCEICTLFNVHKKIKILFYFSQCITILANMIFKSVVTKKFVIIVLLLFSWSLCHKVTHNHCVFDMLSSKWEREQRQESKKVGYG